MQKSKKVLEACPCFVKNVPNNSKLIFSSGKISDLYSFNLYEQYIIKIMNTRFYQKLRHKLEKVQGKNIYFFYYFYVWSWNLSKIGPQKKNQIWHDRPKVAHSLHWLWKYINLGYLMVHICIPTLLWKKSDFRLQHQMPNLQSITGLVYVYAELFFIDRNEKFERFLCFQIKNLRAFYMIVVIQLLFSPVTS